MEVPITRRLATSVKQTEPWSYSQTSTGSYSVIGPSSLTRMLLDLRWPCSTTCIHTLFVLLLLRYSPHWLWPLYVTGITRSVLTGFTPSFFGIILRVGYGLIVCDPVLCKYISTLSPSRKLLPLPTSNGAWPLVSMTGVSRSTTCGRAPRFIPVPSTSYHVKNIL